MGLTRGRRNFFKLAAVSAAALALNGCRSKTASPAVNLPGTETNLQVTDTPVVTAGAARTPVTLPGTETWLLDSKIAPQTYKIFVSFPADYDTSDSTYPVLYLLDANGQFGLARVIVHELFSETKIPDLLIVGIGYPTDDDTQIQLLRYRDFTSTVSNLPNFPSSGAQNSSGLADVFLGFIRDELKPEVNRRYRTQPAEATLIGHSLGGLFCLFTLFYGTSLFNRYVIGSPSIWWGSHAILADEKRYAAKNTSLPAHVYIGAGALEAEIVSDMEDLSNTFSKRAYDGLDLKTEVFDQEAHVSVIPFMMSHGLRAVYESGA